MDYGMYIAASGAATALYRQDVYTNNLANLGTTGFKPDVAVVRQRASVRQEDGVDYLPGNKLLDRLKAGVQLMPNRIDLTAGTIQASSNPLDLAVDGEGFFAVRERTDNGDAVRLTRDGRFLRNSDGLLVTKSGLPVLDSGGSTISIPEGGGILVDANGTIRQRGASIAQLALIGVSDPAQLRKSGEGLFAMSGTDARSAPRGKGIIRQNAFEESAVDEIRMIMQISEASRSVDSNISVIQQGDRLNDRLINVFARVA